MGLANAAILARQNHVTAVDIVAERVDTVNRRESPFADAELSQFLATQDLDLRATLDAEATYADADYVVIATPTDYDPQTLAFDTASVESVIRTVVKVAPHAVPVVKSTVPVGFCERMTAEHGRQVVFSPEFLREGHALHDNLHPSRIIVGDATPEAKTFADLPGGRLRAPRHARPDGALDRGRGDQALLQHLPRDAGRLLQRAATPSPCSTTSTAGRSSTG